MNKQYITQACELLQYIELHRPLTVWSLFVRGTYMIEMPARLISEALDWKCCIGSLFGADQL
jgi:hypothetical protein